MIMKLIVLCFVSLGLLSEINATKCYSCITKRLGNTAQFFEGEGAVLRKPAISDDCCSNPNLVPNGVVDCNDVCFYGTFHYYDLANDATIQGVWRDCRTNAGTNVLLSSLSTLAPNTCNRPQSGRLKRAVYEGRNVTVCSCNTPYCWQSSWSGGFCDGILATTTTSTIATTTMSKMSPSTSSVTATTTSTMTTTTTTNSVARVTNVIWFALMVTMVTVLAWCYKHE